MAGVLVHWKFSAADIRERALGDRYMEAHEEMIRRTAAPQEPWCVVPADHPWSTRSAVAAAIHRALDTLDPAFPKVDKAKRTELAAARKVLLAEK